LPNRAECLAFHEGRSAFDGISGQIEHGAEELHDEPVYSADPRAATLEAARVRRRSADWTLASTSAAAPAVLATPIAIDTLVLSPHRIAATAASRPAPPTEARAAGAASRRSTSRATLDPMPERFVLYGKRQ
jgi:hypothetical protein